MIHVLFICSQNKLRSPTAETIFSGIDGFEVRSAGLNNDAVIPASPDLIEWADYIFVMEKSHRNKLHKKYRKSIKRQRVICLDIPDEYEFMDQELIRLLNLRIGAFFQST